MKPELGGSSGGSLACLDGAAAAAALAKAGGGTSQEGCSNRMYDGRRKRKMYKSEGKNVRTAHHSM